MALAALFFAGCSTVGQVAEINQKTGKIDTKSSAVATVVKSSKLEVEQYRSMLLVLNGDFFRDQTRKIGFFENVVNRQEMEKLLIKDGKAGLVSDVTNLLSWKKIADDYKPFLVLKFDVREDRGNQFAQLLVIDASTADEVFTSEIKLDYVWKGVNDDNTFYPLFNAFIDWIESNRK